MLVEAHTLVFFREALRPSVSKRQGGCTDPLPVCVMKNVLAVRGLTLAGRGGGWCHPRPQTVFPELLENGGGQRCQILAMLPYIQGGPDDVLTIFGSGQVTDL